MFSVAHPYRNSNESVATFEARCNLDTNRKSNGISAKGSLRSLLAQAPFSLP